MNLYRALLHAFPASFQREYGEEMCAVFGRRLRDTRGLTDSLALWIGTLGDVLWNAARVHADILRQDVRFTLRSIRRSPGFAATAILIAALGVGAVTAAFTLTDHVLLRPLPYPHADRLVHIWGEDTVQGYTRVEPSLPNYRDWKASSRSFEAMGAYHFLSANLVGAGRPQHLDGAAVDADLLPILGVAPHLGRAFTTEDHRPGAEGTILLSETSWQRRFGADPSIVGRKVLLDDAPLTVIGVMPRGFRYPNREIEFWTPMRVPEEDANDRSNSFFKVLGRLKPNVPLESARAEMRAIAERLRREYPKENARSGATVVPLRDEVSSGRRRMLVALLGASGSVLLIACSNLANLLLARALSRRRELSVRAALGAGRERLIRQLMTESALLAACGGILGVGLAVAALPLLSRLVPSVLPIGEAPTVDLRMLGFAAVLTGLTGIGFGVVPALRMGRDADTEGLREGPRSGADRRTERLRSLLVVAELTMSVALLVPAGLFLRALWRVQGVDPGFRSESVLTVHTALPLPDYAPVQRRARYYETVLADVRSRPGVESAAYITGLPMVMTGGIWDATPDGRPEDPRESRLNSLRFVTPGFFRTLSIPIRLGRDVEDSDAAGVPFVAVVSASFGRRFWPGQSPLGRRFRIADKDRTIVGVVGDVRVRGHEQDSEPQVYLPYRQVEDGALIGYMPKDLVVRSSEPASALLPAIREAVERADPKIPVSDVRVLSDIVRADTAPRRLQARILIAFAAAAALLAGIGIHGLLAFTVSQRMREIGVRIAMGARPADIVRMVLRRATLLCVVGVAAGASLAYAAGRALQALLAGIPAGDLPTFACAIALAAGIMLVGSLVPAIRAARVDPLTVIRAE